MQTNHLPKIELITSSEQLINVVSELKLCLEISIDTEYDSFQRQYGFKLLLIQIWNGAKVYLIDPIKVRDLSSLWSIFEDKTICKVLYAGSEDIALLKQSGCETKNIYDVQIAATLSNTEARNLGDLMESETGIPVNKKQQTSDWSIRPLTSDQIKYAANDVIHLLTIKSRLDLQVQERGLVHALEEENNALELITQREHIPKIKPIFYHTHSKSFCDALLALLELRDRIAREMNLAPVRVVDTRYLEEALNKRDRFVGEKEFIGFNPRIRNSTAIQLQFLKIINEYDPTDITRYPRERSMRGPSISKSEKDEITRIQFEPVHQDLIEKYGERTAEYLLRGLKKIIVYENNDVREMRNYQREILAKMVR